MRLSYHNPTPTGTPEARDTSIISVRKPGGRSTAGPDPLLDGRPESIKGSGRSIPARRDRLP
jgi:hypothetical protein